MLRAGQPRGDSRPDGVADGDHVTSRYRDLYRDCDAQSNGYALPDLDPHRDRHAESDRDGDAVTDT